MRPRLPIDPDDRRTRQVDPVSDPDWNDFRIILALGRAGSVAGAAGLLAVDASTVSRRLAAAEKVMGAVLVLRGGRVFSLTPEGRAMFAAAEAMEAAVVEARGAVRSARIELQGLVRIACPPVSVGFLRDFPENVRRKHPGLGVELISGRGAADLGKGEADISIRAVRPADLDLVVAHEFELASAVYASTAYLAARGRPGSHEGIAGHALVRYAAPFQHMPAFSWIEQFAEPVAPAVRVDNIDMARTLIASGAGIGVLYCVAGDAEPGIVRLFDEPIDRIGMNIVYHQSTRGSARIRAVLDLLVERHRSDRSRLNGRRD